MQRTLVTLMQNRPGVLHRAVSLFRRRGYNIESLAVGHSETRGVSRMTLVVEADDVEQVIKQLYRLVEVLKVTDVTHGQTLEREAALVKVNAPPARRADILATAHACGAIILDVGESTIMLEMIGPPDQVERPEGDGAQRPHRDGARRARTGRTAAHAGGAHVTACGGGEPRRGRQRDHDGSGHRESVDVAGGWHRMRMIP